MFTPTFSLCFSGLIELTHLTIIMRVYLPYFIQSFYVLSAQWPCWLLLSLSNQLILHIQILTWDSWCGITSSFQTLLNVEQRLKLLPVHSLAVNDLSLLYSAHFALLTVDFVLLVLVVAELLLPISLPAFLLCSCTVHPFKLNCATNCRFYLPVLHSLSRLQYTRWYYWK